MCCYIYIEKKSYVYDKQQIYFGLVEKMYSDKKYDVSSRTLLTFS